MTASSLFPPLEPYRHGMLPVDELHTLYWEECGNPDGEPVLFLHGGPGSGCTPDHRRFFDPAHYRIVLFDQRGAGRSTPYGEYRNNSTPLLIDDIERLREMLGIVQWLLFGGSWGSTLALAYGEVHPQCCTGFILRGIFLATVRELDWFLNGIRWFYPDAYADFIAPIPPEERGNLLQAYVRRMFCDDPAVYVPAAASWSRYEERCLFLRPPSVSHEAPADDDEKHLGTGRMEAHYFAHRAFLDEDQLIRDIGRISHLPAMIVQGRHDVVCPPLSAFRLAQAWPGAVLQVIPDAGHSAHEPGTQQALVAATEHFKVRRGFG